jgi:electron transfer flavoprotein alpha subunit
MFKLSRRWASSLVVVEHKNGVFAGHTLNTLTAAKELGSVTALVSGANKEQLDKVSKSLAKVSAVAKVLVATAPSLEHNLPETCGPLIVSAIKNGGFSHVIAPHSAFGKNLMPRVAALLDVAQISDVMKIEAEDTFTRPFYAGENTC